MTGRVHWLWPHRVLLVLHRQEPDSGGLEDVQGVHEGAAHDAEDNLNVQGGKVLDRVKRTKKG